MEFDKSILDKLQSKYSAMANAAKGVPTEKVSEIKLNLPPRRCGLTQPMLSHVILYELVCCMPRHV